MNIAGFCHRLVIDGDEGLVGMAKTTALEPLRSEKNCTRRRNELITKGAMNTGE